MAIFLHHARQGKLAKDALQEICFMALGGVFSEQFPAQHYFDKSQPKLSLSFAAHTSNCKCSLVPL